jgi:hypothetical protein
MAFEREAIAPSGPAPVATQIEMREERVINPYQSRVKAKIVGATSHQENINTGTSAAPPATEAPQSETVTLSPAAAAIARREQKFRQQEQEFKAQKELLAKKETELNDVLSLKAKLEAKDYSAFDGKVDYQDYTNYIIEKSAKADPQAEKLRAIEEKIDSVEKAHREETSKRFEAAVSERRKAVDSLIEAKPEFSRLKKAKATEHVVQHILDTWENDSVDLDPETAAKEVDQILKERAKQWAELLAEEKEAATEADSKALPPLKTGVKTLTNSMTPPGEIKRPNKSFQGMSDSERYAEARRRAEEKLKQQRI